MEGELQKLRLRPGSEEIQDALDVFIVKLGEFEKLGRAERDDPAARVTACQLRDDMKSWLRRIEFPPPLLDTDQCYAQIALRQFISNLYEALGDFARALRHNQIAKYWISRVKKREDLETTFGYEFRFWLDEEQWRYESKLPFYVRGKPIAFLGRNGDSSEDDTDTGEDVRAKRGRVFTGKYPVMRGDDSGHIAAMTLQSAPNRQAASIVNTAATDYAPSSSSSAPSHQHGTPTSSRITGAGGRGVLRSMILDRRADYDRVARLLPRVAGGRLVGLERRRARMDGEQEGDETLM